MSAARIARTASSVRPSSSIWSAIMSSRKTVSGVNVWRPPRRLIPSAHGIGGCFQHGDVHYRQAVRTVRTRGISPQVRRWASISDRRRLNEWSALTISSLKKSTPDTLLRSHFLCASFENKSVAYSRTILSRPAHCTSVLRTVSRRERMAAGDERSTGARAAEVLLPAHVVRMVLAHHADAWRAERSSVHRVHEAIGARVRRDRRQQDRRIAGRPMGGGLHRRVPAIGFSRTETLPGEGNRIHAPMKPR